jgi:Asp-tRNA(Asn)/Glu-tRNA(Gln) amidotransferase A subunit family amidase
MERPVHGEFQNAEEICDSPCTNWVNMIGVPAVVVPAGFYASGLPFGLEFSARPWTDGDLLGIAYAWEQATRLRKPPTLVEHGLLAITPAREPRARRVGL